MQVINGRRSSPIAIIIALLLLVPIAWNLFSCKSDPAPLPDPTATTTFINGANTSPSLEPTTSTSQLASSSASAPPSAHPTTSPTAGSGTALAMVQSLKVKGRAPKTGYSRAQFGPAWFDTDGNGCDTRDDMLRKYLRNATYEGDCIVLSGVLDDPYTGRAVSYVRGGFDEIDVDHMVSLLNAWQTGAQYWPAAKRLALANDPLNLQPTAASVNRQKSDADAASWLPSNKRYRCHFVARQVAVKRKYQLWLTPAEQTAILSVLNGCRDLPAPGPGPNPTLAN